jgi:membrane protein
MAVNASATNARRMLERWGIDKASDALQSKGEGMPMVQRLRKEHAARGSDADRALQAGRGRSAETPFQIPLRGLMDVAWRLWDQVGQDRILLVAAGTTFYALLALFPALTAFVSLYGFVADPKTLADHIAFLASLLPSDGFDLIRNQLHALANQTNDVLSLGFLSGLAIAFWSANSGIKGLFEGLNVAYGENEKRSFIKLNLVSFAFTLGAIVIGICFLLAVGVIPAVLSFFLLDPKAKLLVDLLRWPPVFLLAAGGVIVLYRYGPSRERAKWRWLTWGAGLTTVAWLAASWGFSFYLGHFANYNVTYGALGAVIGFMMWIWISAIIILLGAELNAELEHQTARDSTTGSPRPIGKRGAVMADTIGRASDEQVSAED